MKTEGKVIFVDPGSHFSIYVRETLVVLPKAEYDELRSAERQVECWERCLKAAEEALLPWRIARLSREGRVEVSVEELERKTKRILDLERGTREE